MKDNSGEIHIEKIAPGDSLDACAEILVSAYNGEPWNDNWTAEKALEKLTCFCNSPKFLGWKAYQDDQLTGCCVGNIEPYYTGDYFFLKEMFVSPRAQGQGIGVRLLEVIKRDLETFGIHQIILFTTHAGFPFNFYLNAGFSEMDGMRMLHFGE